MDFCGTVPVRYNGQITNVLRRNSDETMGARRGGVRTRFDISGLWQQAGAEYEIYREQ
ncbi:MAG: hypothetical protein LKG24_03145 [Lacticaseibacillus songhuajiangensis]|nr:hypothetical protein [Lacticaseibacillus songhuajiangensis]